MDNIICNCCPWPKNGSWPWTKVTSPSSSSLCTHGQHSCPGHNSLLPCWIWKIFHIIVVRDQRVYHDLDSRSYFQGHSAHVPKILVRALTPYCHFGSGKYFTQLLSMFQGCVMTLTQGHISKAKVTVHIPEIRGWAQTPYCNFRCWQYIAQLLSESVWFVQCVTFHELLKFGWYLTQLLSVTKRLLLQGVFVSLGHVLYGFKVIAKVTVYNRQDKNNTPQSMDAGGIKLFVIRIQYCE